MVFQCHFALVTHVVGVGLKQGWGYNRAYHCSALAHLWISLYTGGLKHGGIQQVKQHVYRWESKTLALAAALFYTLHGAVVMLQLSVQKMWVRFLAIVGGALRRSS